MWRDSYGHAHGARLFRPTKTPVQRSCTTARPSGLSGNRRTNALELRRLLGKDADRRRAVYDRRFVLAYRTDEPPPNSTPAKRRYPRLLARHVLSKVFSYLRILAPERFYSSLVPDSKMLRNWARPSRFVKAVHRMLEQIWNKKTTKQVKQDRSGVFETTVLPYVSTGYNLARWLTRNEQDAEDALQEASLRAWRAFDTFQPGRDPRAWFLAIVRNTCRTLHRQKQDQEMAIQLEDDSQAVDTCLNAKTMLIKKENLQTVHQAR
jgi:hypothetical protein